MIDLIILVSLLLMGYFFGSRNEKLHYRSIREREKILNQLPAVATRKVPSDFPPCTTMLVAGSAVISVDYFKKFVAGLQLLIGGRVSGYESLIDRARREAVLRMKESARQLNASHVFNVKMETASIAKGYRGAVGCVEVLAYGTAMITSPETVQFVTGGQDKLVTVNVPEEKTGIFMGIVKAAGVLFLLLVSLIIGFEVFYSGPEVTAVLRHNDQIPVNTPFALELDLTNENDELAVVDHISLDNVMFDNFNVTYTAGVDLDQEPISSESTTTWYLGYEMQPGENVVAAFDLTPKKVGELPISVEVCNEYQDCTSFATTVNVKEGP